MLVESGLKWGAKYFAFLDDSTRTLCEKWFALVAREETLQGEVQAEHSRQLSSRTLHLEIMRSLHTNFLSRKNTVILGA